MAGKPKSRIDYAGWSVDIFSNDTKIDRLLDAQGWVGFGIYFYLCQMAYGSEGYFYEWSYDLCATTARKMGGGVGSGTVKETVDYCLHIGLFDKRLFDRWKVLSSRGIQKNYLQVIKNKKRTGTIIYNDFWLLDTNSEDYQGVLFVDKNINKLGVNDDSLGVNGNKLGVNSHSRRQKESKVNNSKVIKDIVHCQEDANALFERLWLLYPNKKGKGQVSTKTKTKLLTIGYEKMSVVISRYVAELERDKDWRKPQNGSTFFNSGYVDYLDENYVPSSAKPKKSGFGSFPQNDYDFNALEKELGGI